jgi:hypothetical protein
MQMLGTIIGDIAGSAHEFANYPRQGLQDKQIDMRRVMQSMMKTGKLKSPILSQLPSEM